MIPPDTTIGELARELAAAACAALVLWAWLVLILSL